MEKVHELQSLVEDAVKEAQLFMKRATKPPEQGSETLCSISRRWLRIYVKM